MAMKRKSDLKGKAPKVVNSKEYGKGKANTAGAQAPPPPKKAPGKWQLTKKQASSAKHA